jgi:hypothetical protein
LKAAKTHSQVLRPAANLRVMPSLTLKPTHKAVVAYYASLAKFARLGVKYETAVRSAFQELLEHCARQFDWKLVPEYRIKRKGHADASADGALLDNYGLNHGLWEAKDSADDLEKEIKHKFSIGYPKQNILFWQPDRAVLYQNGEVHFEADLKNADDLVKILTHFLEFAPPAIAEWEKAVEEFKDKVPQIGASLKDLIEKERQTNKKFIAAFEDFCSLCRGSLNPNISIEAVEEMIIQHILTERIFRKIFDVADFMQRNVIALEIEKVIAALNSRSFSRDDFSKSLEHFYGAIENAAATITDFHEKQTFLNTVYERFFQGFCVKVADTIQPYYGTWEWAIKYGRSYSQSERDLSWQGSATQSGLADRLQSWYIRNFYYSGHGSANSIGGDMNIFDSTNNPIGATNFPGSKAKLTSQWVKDNVTKNKSYGAIPYRFVFLDGCDTANGDWPQAWGTPKQQVSVDYFRNNKIYPRPCAFVGWNVTIGGKGWGTVDKWWDFRKIWMGSWSGTIAQHLDWAFEVARDTSGWIAPSDVTAHLREYGYTSMTFQEYNNRGNWP